MDVTTVFNLGLEIFDNYSEAMKQPGSSIYKPSISYMDESKLNRFGKTCNFYKIFEESGHSYITAYRTANYDATYRNLLIQAIDASRYHHQGTSSNRRERFMNIFYKELTKELLHVHGVSDPVRHDTVPSYSFLMEAITCKEAKKLVLMLLFVGMMSVVLGASSALGVAAATTGLASVGVSATAALIGGAISTAIGLSLLLFTPRDNTTQWSTLEAHVADEIAKNAPTVG